MNSEIDEETNTLLLPINKLGNLQNYSAIISHPTLDS
jgi:hypothetical protein